jgi:DNA mismatch endonuclease (patch repair protein)
VIFVHGCYWHGHGCKRGGSGAKSNIEYWSAKIQRNVRRDEETIAKLVQAGWRVKVVWECEIHDVSKLFHDLSAFLDDADGERKPAGVSGGLLVGR